MEMQNNEPIRTPPRRRRRSKMQIFKEAYLPTIILCITAVLVAVFIIGGILKKDKPSNMEDPSTSTSGSQSSTESKPSDSAQSTSPSTSVQAQEAANLLQQAALLAQDYDYQGAISTLESFSGVKADFPELAAAIEQYQACDEAMVTWRADQVYDLSFHVLVADPQRAFSDAVYSSSYRNNFITTTEFTNILNALYQGDYILVDLDDLYALEYSSTYGTEIYVEKQLRLPEGKTPVMLTEINASYYGYMQSGDQDGLADGFASRLAYDGNHFYNEMILADGSVSTGAYDMVPLLEEFIAAHPDFSYRDARAVVAFAGYDRILGYRINDNTLDADALQAERDGLTDTIQALKDAGYKIGCYSYNNVSYTGMSAESVQSDIAKWAEHVTPWLGKVDIMVFAREGDISDKTAYTGNSRFTVLYNAGFRYFLGTGTETWSQVDNRYVRHNRLMITGTYLKNKPERFTALFDASTILDSARN